MSPTLSPLALQALKACIASRGPNKGHFLASAPSYARAPLANAAWNAAMLVVNPFKVSIVGVVMLRGQEEAMTVFREVKAFFEANPELRHLDHDRSALERLGVW